MKTCFLCVLQALLLVSFSSCCQASGDVPDAVRAAEGVVKRTFGFFPRNVDFVLIDKDSTDIYRLSVSDGRLVVEGSSPVAICKGFHDYILENGYGVASWTGNRLDLPRRLPDMEVREVVSPYRHHLYYNVCTYGYTTPFWQWEEWEREIDWMALHGFDMPLSPVGGESILAKVWRDMGLPDEAVHGYFTGPAHFPWMRMGNIAHFDGGMSSEWFEEQIALAHKIDDREKSLGMTPVYQGFAGFVPAEFEECFPGSVVTENIWSTFDPKCRNHMLSPLDPMFGKIGEAFIREWEKEFGKGRYYLIDSFNELSVPFGPLGSPERYATLRKYSETLYSSLAAANPEAVWVMQGWMFGYQREEEWDRESVRALLEGAPDGKLLIVDLAVDFNEFVWKSERSWDYYDGFFGKDWIWSTVPNFGGRTALLGPLEFHLNNHLQAMASPSRGNLIGFGTSPEGIENNEVLYEAISAAGWSHDVIDVKDFLDSYTRARYGRTAPGLETFWEEMLQSQYGNFTNNARFWWQRRPPFHAPHTMAVNEHYFKAIEAFLSEKDKLRGNRLYEADAVGYGAFYLAGKADIVLDSLYNELYKADADFAKAKVMEDRLIAILTDMDRLLESHPVFNARRWMDLARAAAAGPGDADAFELEAKRLISTWGGGELVDYSARIWAGLIRDFYIPRLKFYFDSVIAAEERLDLSSQLAALEEEGFPAHTGLSPVEPFADPVEAAYELINEYAVESRSDEAETPDCTLPDPLVTAAGKKIRTVRQWERTGRPEVYALFESEMFGKMPGRPAGLHFKVLSEDKGAFGGMATRKEVAVYPDETEKQCLTLLMYVPNGVEGPVPAFLGLNFKGNHATTYDPEVSVTMAERTDGYGPAGGPAGSPAARGETSVWWPYEYILSSGYAVVTFCREDADPDWHDGFRNGVHGLIDGDKPRGGDSWGTIAAWAWGLSRALDYLETDKDIDSRNVAVFGHSRLGKAALWAGASDSRFALVISNNSGCSGAALSRRAVGENLHIINTAFPHWFCTNYHKYNGRENELPFDQHELIALIAPRPVYVASASKDTWADPEGEMLALVNASKVYELYGYERFAMDSLPPVNTPVHTERMAYHLRDGEHDILLYDWQQYVAFADRVLRKSRKTQK